jgi:hypothetical protein
LPPVINYWTLVVFLRARPPTSKEASLNYQLSGQLFENLNPEPAALGGKLNNAVIVVTLCRKPQFYIIFCESMYFSINVPLNYLLYLGKNLTK